MRKLLTLTFSLYIIFGFAQSELSKLPEITVNDLETTHCSFDSSANAQILYDYGETRFLKSGGRLIYEFERTTRIQILNKDGYEHSKIEIPFYNEDPDDKENISYFKASSYSLENGKIVTTTVKKSSLYEEKINKLWSKKKYAFPNIKPGTIIEYTYKFTSPYITHLRQWYFQHHIPVADVRYKISLCPHASYVVVKNGFLEYDFDTVYTEPFGFSLDGKWQTTNVYEWELKNVPAFTDSKYITTNEDYLMSVEFQLDTYYPFYGGIIKYNTTWKKLMDRLIKETDDFGGYIKENKGGVKEIISRLDLNGKDDITTIKTIVNYVKTNYHYNGYSGIYAKQSMKNLVRTKTGTAPEINLFMLSLLNAAGIEVYPLLLSTRQHGLIYYNYPMLNSFNYVAVIAKTDKGSIILDGTDPFLPYTLLPHYCINDFGLEVSKIEKESNAMFYPLNPLPDKNMTQELITLDPETDSVHTVVASKIGGYGAAFLRELYVDSGNDGVADNIQEKVSGTISNMTIDKIKDIDKDLVLKYKIENKASKAGNKLIISPFPYNEYMGSVFTEENRDYPIDFGKMFSEKYIITFQIPDEYELDYAPESQTIKELDGTLIYNSVVVNNNNILQIMSEVKTTKVKYEPEEYPILKNYFDKITKFHNEKIILRKK